MTTPPIVFAGNRLILNVDCGAAGEVWGELQDADGKPIPGYTMAQAVSMDRNTSSPPHALGQTVRLSVYG